MVEKAQNGWKRSKMIYLGFLEAPKFSIGFFLVKIWPDIQVLPGSGNTGGSRPPIDENKAVSTQKWFK